MNQKKSNKYGWTRKRVAVAVVAGAMAVLLLIPTVLEIVTLAIA